MGPEPGGEAATFEVPGYVVGEHLGSGGFGAVFRARQTVINREVAIKVLHAKYSADGEAVARFVSEARAVAQLSHPGIVDLFEFGELPDGRRYYAMELIHGRTLRDVLRERGRLALGEALPILRGIAEAVDAAHAAGIAHRDLKPDNVFVLDGGGVKLIDFGLAKLMHEQDAPVTQTGSVFGTPLYMSPEQCRGKAITPATDAYSFGALAYHVLVGEPPFSGEALEIALHHLNDLPEPPSSRCGELDQKTDRMILALLAKDPAARPASLVAALDGHLPRRSRWKAWALAGGAAVAVAIAAVAITRDRAPSESTGGYSERRIVTRFDGVAELFRILGGKLAYGDSSGIWRLSLASGVTERVEIGEGTLATLPDGRQVVVDRGGDHTLALVDPHTHAREVIGTVSADVRWLTRTDDLRLFALVEDGWVTIHDLKTHASRRLVEVHVPYVDAKLSPDGTLLLWGSETGPGSSRLHLTRVADGSTRVFSVPLLAEDDMTSPRPADFVDDQHFAYCAAGQPGTVRVRAVDDGDGSHEVVIATLDAAASLCNVVSSRDRIAVLITRHKPSFGVFDLATKPARLQMVAGTATRRLVEELDAEGEHALVDEQGTLVSIATTNGAVAPATTCPHAEHFARRGRELDALEVEQGRDHVSLKLRTLPACDLAAEWQLPVGSAVGKMVCGGHTCFVAAEIEQHLTVWRLEPGSAAHELAHSPETESPVLRELAVSPDEKTIVVVLKDLHQLAIVQPDGSFAPIQLEGNPLQGNYSSIAWGRDPGRFLVALQVQSYGYGLSLVAPDGAHETLWTSQTTWVGGLRASHDSDRVATTARPIQQELLVLDRRHE